MRKDKKLAYGFLLVMAFVILATVLAGCGIARDALYLLEYNTGRDSSRDLYKVVPRE